MQQPETTYYRIAGLLVEVQDFTGMDMGRALPSFTDFRASLKGAEVMVSLRIEQYPESLELPARKILSDVSVIWHENFRFEENENYYFTSILGRDGASWIMLSHKDFQNSTIYLRSEELYSTTKLSWLIMVAFGQACLAHRALLIHASVVENGRDAIAFLGKSGTGKSTHASLWLENLPDFTLLNDDNPAIRIMSDSSVLIYGTPWSGKTHCYRNTDRLLQSIIRLEQASENEISDRKGLLALTTLLPSASAIRWNSKLYGQMLNNLEDILISIKVGHLRCLPNAAAAELCHSFVFEKKIY